MANPTDDVGMAEGLRDPIPAGPHGPAANASTVEAIEDARAVAGSLLGLWKRDRQDLWELQRPWPSLDPTLPRGALRHPSALISEHAGADNPDSEARRKRQRREAEAATQGGQEAAVVKPDGSLELPNVPEVPQEVVEKVLGDRRRCGVCAACRTLPRSGKPQAACIVLQATRQWTEALGGVTYAAVREVALKIAAPRHDVKLKGRLGRGVRCGLCPTCTSKNTKACVIPAAIAADTLPPRLRAAAAEGTAAAVREGEQGQGGRISLQDYIAQLPAHSRAELNPAAGAASALGGGGGGDGLSDDEDELRWAAWGEFLIHPPTNAQQGDVERLERLQPRRRQPGIGCAGGGARPTAPEAARRQGVDPESITEWVCRASVPSAELPTPQRVTRRRSSAGTPQPAHMEECGHANGKGAFSCESCGAPRWDGDLGQLRARVAAALQGGLLVGASGLPAPEADAALAAAVAARMAAEAGTDPHALFGFQGTENRAEGGDGGDDIGGSGPEGALQEVYDAVKEVRREMEAAAVPDRPAREASGRSGSAHATAAAARATQLAGAVIELEGAVCRLVEEQEGLAAAMRRRMGAQAEDKGRGTAAAAQAAETHSLRALRSLRALLAEDRVAPTSRPGSAESEEAGGNGEGGADATETVGFSAFSARVSACLSGAGGQHDSPPSDGRHRSICELLFCCPPPSPTPGWTETTLTLLEAVLCDAQAMEILTIASHAGGTPMVRRAVHALLRLAERSAVAAAAAEGGEFPASGGSQMQASQQLMFPPTQLSQPDPGLPALDGKAATPAAAPPPPADAGIAQSIADLDDIVAAYEAQERQAPSLASSDASADAADGTDTRRLAHVSAATLSFLYGLTHAVLDTVALRKAETLMPIHLASAKATIMEHSHFPRFPPLPPPAFLEPPVSGNSATDVYHPVPDSRRPAQGMAPGIAPRSRRPPLLPRSELGPSSVGAFAAWDGGNDDVEAVPCSQHPVGGDAMTAAEAAVALCDADAQLVFTEALKGGMRPEAVAEAARRYVALTAAGAEEG